MIDQGSGWDDGSDIRSQLRMVLENEPPFETATPLALAAAARRGRRRRIGTTVLGAACVAAVGAVATAGVIALRPQEEVGFALQPAASPPRPTPTPAPTTAPVLPSQAELMGLAEAIAGLADGETVTTVPAPFDDEGGLVSAELMVEIAGSGTFWVEVGAIPPEQQSDNLLDLWGEPCELAAVDDRRPCQQLARTDTDGAWLTTHTDQPGREAMAFVALAASYPGLSLLIDNNVEQADGSDGPGPRWQDVGITVDEIRQVVAESGILD